MLKKFDLKLSTTILCLLYNCGYTPMVIAAKHTELQILTNKITALQKTLSFDHYKEQKISKQIAQIDKQINLTAKKLDEITQDAQNQQTKINELTLQIEQYRKQLSIMQQRLSQHLITRYKINELSPIKWIINAKQIEEGHRIIMYYQYIIDNDKQIITEIAEKQTEINEQEQQLRQQQDEQQKLTIKLQQQKQNLIQQKLTQEQLLTQLNQTMHSTQNQLSSYEKNKQQLSHIVAKLSNTSVIQTRHSFAQMKHDLPSPLSTLSNKSHRFHQGILFDAKEGTPVYSVYPGKVVFADWLNGYGLLVIVDHGWGFMTLYANNKTLFKHNNDLVQAHELIANVGHTGSSKQDGLYFEIRHYGKTIASMDWFKTKYSL